MKLAVAFNIFSGLEFLKPSILNIRDFTDYIVGVYSTISNDGEPSPVYMMDLLNDLKKEKLLDDIIKCDPVVTTNSIEMAINDRAKRETTRIYCKQKGYTHFMMKDCDEFYEYNQLFAILSALKDYELILAPIIDYIKTPLYRLNTVSILHVPVIHAIDNYYCPYQFEVLVSPDRTINTTKVKICKPTELVMHHMTNVRINEIELKRKRVGSSSYSQVSFEEFWERVNNFPVSNLISVKDQFNIMSYWEGEFQKYV
jgi:hypothetical protein